VDASSVAGLAFEMLATGELNETGILAALRVEGKDYIVTDELRMLTLQAKKADMIGEDTLLRILNG
jgi:hypothetical protein